MSDDDIGKAVAIILVAAVLAALGLPALWAGLLGVAAPDRAQPGGGGGDTGGGDGEPGTG